MSRARGRTSSDDLVTAMLGAVQGAFGLIGGAASRSRSRRARGGRFLEPELQLPDVLDKYISSLLSDSDDSDAEDENLTEMGVPFDLSDSDNEDEDALQPAQHTSIARLPTHVLTSCDLHQTAEHNKACSICLEDFQAGNEVMTLPCLHRFCKGCIDPWLKRQGECPNCKCRVDDSPQQRGRPVATPDRSRFGSVRVMVAPRSGRGNAADRVGRRSHPTGRNRAGTAQGRSTTGAGSARAARGRRC